MSPSSPEPFSASTLLAEPTLRQALADWVRRRAPSEAVDDIVQATLTEALSALAPPQQPEELRRWLWGIARHKVADYHRLRTREASDELPELAGESGPHSVRDLMRWAERELPPGSQARQTFEWLLREGDGEKLESIAADEKLPAPQLRQRVSRLRRHFRDRWAAQAAALSLLLALAAGIWWWTTRGPKPLPEPLVHREPVPSASVPSPSLRQAEPLRRLAKERCAEGNWAGCLEALDQAAALDPEGDKDEAVQKMRRDAHKALTPPSPSSMRLSPPLSPVPTSTESLPSPSVPPRPRPTSPSKIDHFRGSK